MSKSKYDGATVGDLEKRIEDGKVFEGSSLITVANAGGVGQWLVRTGNKNAIIHSRKITTNGNEMTYQAFVSPTVTVDGTSIQVVKRNGNSTIEPVSVAFASPTVSAKGSPLPAIYMPGSTGIGSSTSSQFDQDGFVRVLSKNTDYLLEITNDGAKNPANAEIYLLWAELDDPAPFSS